MVTLSARRLLGGALALALVPVAPAAAAEVTVRVEGDTATLVREVRLETPRGTVGKNPRQRCAGGAALGALHVATGGRWNGAWFDLGYLIQSIRGERHDGDPTFWSFWLNNRLATTGVCQAELEDGDEVLFFVDRCVYDPVAQACENDPVLPLAVRAPRRATTGRAFTVTVVRYDSVGRTKPVPGATVRVGDRAYQTGGRGRARVRVGRRATVGVRAIKDGFARSAVERVTVRRR